MCVYVYVFWCGLCLGVGWFCLGLVYQRSCGSFLSCKSSSASGYGCPNHVYMIQVVCVCVCVLVWIVLGCWVAWFGSGCPKEVADDFSFVGHLEQVGLVFQTMYL